MLDFGSSPILRTDRSGKPVIVAGNESGIVYAFDAADGGKLRWQHDVGLPPGEGSVLGGQAADHDTVYVGSFQRAPVEGVYEKGHVFEPLPRGALTALDLRTGERRWQIVAPEVPCARAGGTARVCPATRHRAVPASPCAGSGRGVASSRASSRRGGMGRPRRGAARSS